MVLPIVLPFIELDFSAPPIKMPLILLNEVPVNVGSALGSAQESSNWQLYIPYLISFLLITIFINKLIYLRLSLTGSENIKFGRLRIFLTQKQTPAWSFLNCMVIPALNPLPHRRKGIIAHEMEHIRQWHSLDVLLAEILCCLFWFNPILWIFRRLIVQNHEYLADYHTKNFYQDLYHYKQHLFESLTGIQLPLVSTFTQKTLKNRLQMIHLSQNKPTGRLRPVLISLISLLMLGGSVLLFQKPLKAGISTPQDTETSISAQYPGGHDALISFIKSNIRYPESARTKGLSGIVYLQFFVEADGSLGEVKVIKGFDNECDAEALRVLKLCKKWIPVMKEGKGVKSSNTLPVKFALDSSEPVAEFNQIKQHPSFPGGDQARIEYLQSNLKYPENAKKNKVQGTVYITFLVKRDGSISDVKILRGIGSGCDEEAVAAIKSMPKWNPGLNLQGEAVAVVYNMPIKFKLDVDKKDDK
jgi:TonB family protein